MVAPVMALAQGPGEGGPIIEGNWRTVNWRDEPAA